MTKMKCAIIGSGNIGTDLMIKLLKGSDTLELAAVVGIDPASEGLAMASERGVPTTHEGIEGLCRMPQYADIGIAFLFAANHHPAMARITPIRRRIGKRTIFNLMGPLANPARVSHQLIGIARPDYAGLYAEALEQVRGIAASLLARGMNADTPVIVISGNGVDHGLLALAGQYIGVPIVPVAEQYALIHGAHGRLRHAVEMTKPRMAYTVDADQYGEALALDIFDDIEVVASNPGQNAKVTPFADLVKGDAGVDVNAAFAATGPDTVGKILLTSGSTSAPKGGPTTNRMMTTNQAQLAAALSVERPNLVAVTDELTRRGLISRERVPSDRRTYALRLTTAGARLLAQATEALRQAVQGGPAAGRIDTAPPAPEPAPLTVAERRALPFSVDMPAGAGLYPGRSGPEFDIFSVRREGRGLVMIYVGPQSQFPIYSGEQRERAGRRSIIVTENGRNLALEHVYRLRDGVELHVWVSAVSDEDRALADVIGQTVEPR